MQISNFKYNQEQKAILNNFLKHDLLIVTGGPGTESSSDFGILAPTGRASGRIKDISGYPTSTIHRFLGYSGNNQFDFNEKNKKTTGLIVLDEVSMIDQSLFSSLLNGISLPKKMVLVGDIDQLPSVSYGNVFEDLINSEVFEVNMLEVNNRQTSENTGGIIELANAIKNDAVDKFDFSKYKDIEFYDDYNLETIISKYMQNLFTDQNENTLNLQIITAMYKGEMGIDNTNNSIQEKIIHNKNTVYKRITNKFYENDKIIFTENNNQKNLFNGDVGFIKELNIENKNLVNATLNFNESLSILNKEDFKTINLAYCISIHKTQGIGVGASGFEVINNELFLTKNNGTYLEYKKSFEKLSDEDYMFQILMMGLRMKEGIDLKEADNKLAFEFYKDKIQKQILSGEKLMKTISKSKKPLYVSMDLGTSSTLVYVSGQGIVYNEPSIVAYKIPENKIIGVGKSAADMIGKGNKSIRVIAPMQGGVITDVKATQSQLKFILRRLRLEKSLEGCVMLLACPSVITELEKAALKKIATNLGAKEVFIEEEVKMAALGGGVNIFAPTGKLIIDMGGGTTDVAVLSSGDIVLSKSIKVAGNYLNEEVLKFVRSQYGLEIGIKSAETIKINIGSLSKFPDERNIKAYGRDVVSGLPREIEIRPEEIREVLKVPVSRIVDLTVQVLEETPPELAGDIFRNGITICGGGALIRGIDKYFADTLQLPTTVGEQPLLAVINVVACGEEDKSTNKNIINGLTFFSNNKIEDLTNLIDETKIKNKTVMKSTETILGSGMFEIQNKIIKSINQGETKQDGIDLKGQIIMPGFIDCHVHGGYGVDFETGTVEGYLEFAKNVSKEGITRYYQGTVTNSQENNEKYFPAFKEFIKIQNDYNYSKCMGCHMEGPFISPEKKGAHELSLLIKPNIEYLKNLQKLSGDNIRIVTYAPELQDGSFTKYLLEQNILPSMGHSNIKATEAIKDYKIGAKHITHLFNGMSVVNHQEPGLATFGLNQEDVLVEVISDGIHVHPEVLKLIYKAKGSKGICIITDSMNAKGLSDGEYKLGNLEVIKTGMKVALKDSGVLAGSGATFDHNIRTYKSVIEDLSLNDIANMSSTNIAKQLGIYDKTGSIKENKLADLTVLNDKYEVQMTICEGNMVFKK
ncbi:hypothetical protein FQR65_LT16620 [Abscondita terminalis]|nr:hypothetical protein FQR65_LT16620 [Abscondita terminalis]